MKTIQRLVILLLVLLGISTGAWAIEQDSEGYYLIGSVQDWKDFAALVENTNQAANAKMIADVDLGDDQTTIGSPQNRGTVWYQGTFDGDGHTLTIAYNNTSGEIFTTPFTLIQGATIMNLHIDGTVNTVYAYGGSVASIGRGSNTLKNIWNSVTSVCTMGGWDQMGAFFGVLESGGSMDVSDCLFTGSMSHPGGYSGYFSGGYGPGPHVSNCLVLGEFTGSYGFNGSFTNCYLKHASTTGVTIPTDEQLADGTIATALGDAWVQDPGTNLPLPKIFATMRQDEDGYYLIGSVTDWRRFAELVNSGRDPAANAKMICDVDLGDDQTRIGSTSDNNSAQHYKGVFDGQGYRLTIAYIETGGSNLCAPFNKLDGATIKNLHIKGTINTAGIHGAGVASDVRGTTLIQNVWIEVDVTSTHSGWDECSGIVGCMKAGSLTITDCLFSGNVTANSSYNGGFIGYKDSGTASISNCLSTGTFAYGSNQDFSRGATVSNSYYTQFVGSTTGLTLVTDTQLADGTIATALQADRSEEVWVQDPELGIPMLKIFVNEETELPSDALNGEFSITDDGIRVVFSRGNLQNVNNTWQFAIHQYDYFGTNQFDTHRDMFAYNDFSLPNNDENWFNMTHDQWVYLLRDRSVTNTLSDGARFTMATIGGTYKGVILFPDNYTHPEEADFTSGVFNSNSNYTAQVSLEGWALMEAAGCVFLPACGWNSVGSEWKSVGETAVYSTSSVYPTGSRYYTPGFYVDRIDLDEWCNRATWTPVRLVQIVSDLDKDADGYYLIGSLDDWKNCSSLIKLNPNINIRMVADIDLGNDQTELGSENIPYKGVFDGQGHILTIAYSATSSSSDHVAPFAKIENATIENLHIKGTITTAGMRPASITSYVSGVSYIRNCWSEVAITSNKSADIDAGGFVARVNSSQTLHIEDCTFTGSITYNNGSGYEVGGIVGWCQESGIVQMQNCLFAPASIKMIKSDNANKMFVSGYQGNVHITNCYYRIIGSMEQWSEQGIATTEDELTDCTTSAALQNGRSEDVWVQDPLTNQPLPKIFATLQDEDGNYLISSVPDWKRFAAIVETTPTANAKMLADVDLGDDQTMVGSESVPYQGTFDGLGNKLTIAYDVTENYVAPFRVVNGATIQNLEVAGTINTTAEYAGGIIGYTPSSSTASNVIMCRSSVSIVGHSSISDRTDWHGGFVGLVYAPVHFTDCLSDGKITGSSSPARSYCTGFIGLARGGTSIFTNCLNNCELDVYATNGLWHFIGGTGSVTNSYVNNTISYTAGYSQATAVTGEQLSNGTVTAMLQNNREEDIWVLDPVLGYPMLKIFSNEITYTVPSSGVGTFSAKGQVQLPDGLTAHYCRTYHKKNSTISVIDISGNIIPANTGVLLSGTPGETFTLTGACGQAPTITDNELVPVTEPTHINATDGDYTNFMMKGGKFIKIANDNALMPAHRAYLPLLTAAISGSNAKEITLLWDEGEATGIEGLTPTPSPKGEGSIYNLNGQRISTPLKGINIINGRKVIVK